MSLSYVYFADRKIIRDGLEGYLIDSPALPVPVRMLSWGGEFDPFYIDMNGARHNITEDELVTFTDVIMPLVNEDSFELGNLYIERSSLTSKIEATDYVEFGVANSYFAEADYIGILNDRKVWVARLKEIKIRISEIESLVNPY